MLLAALCSPAFLYAGRALAMGGKPQDFNAGVRTLAIWVDKSKRMLEAAVWYPTRRKTTFSTISEWTMPAAHNAAETPGRYPVILISHDMAMNRFTNNNLACALASNGFIVIAVTHTGDNMDGAEKAFSLSNLFLRPRQLLLAFEAALANKHLGPLIDQTRIGVLGVGTGAVTALQLAGASPQAPDYATYCEESSTNDVFCGKMAQAAFALWPAMMEKVTGLGGPQAFTPKPDAMREPFARLNPVEKPPSDAGRIIRAVGLMAPGGVMFFPPESLAGLNLPVGAIIAAQDELYPPDLQARRMLERIPPSLRDPSDILTLPESDHYSLNAPCPQDLLLNLPEICGSKAGEEREELSARRDAHFIRFFKAYLGAPLPPEQAEGDLAATPIDGGPPGSRQGE